MERPRNMPGEVAFCAGSGINSNRPVLIHNAALAVAHGTDLAAGITLYAAVELLGPECHSLRGSQSHQRGEPIRRRACQRFWTDRLAHSFIGKSRSAGGAESALGLAHAFAGHPDHVNVFALQLRFFFQNHQRLLIAGFHHDRGLAQGFDFLALQIAGEIADAAVVPDQAVCVFRTPHHHRPPRSVSDNDFHRALGQQFAAALAKRGLGGQSLRFKQSGRAHREVFARAVGIEIGVRPQLPGLFGKFDDDLLPLLPFRR